MNNYAVYLVIFLSVDLSILLGHVAGSKVLQIRGIPVAKNSLYSADRDFQCLDGSLLIPFAQVNDDYCDCADGSDEPGTPACTNGSFYCENSGHKPRYIPSTWVNDGVCDCCDASDEYSSGMECPNNCNDLGREARLEQQKAEELIREGNKIRVEMIAKGKQLKTDYQSRLIKLRADYEEAELMKKEKELLKSQAEERENAALEKYKPAEPEQPAAEDGEEEEELQEYDAEDYFKVLDSDNSGTISVAELQTRVTFDKDRDGVITEEEAMFFLNNKKEIGVQEFVESAWSTIKPFLMLEQGVFKSADQKEGYEEDDHDPEEQTEQDKEEDDGTEEEAGDAQEKPEEPPVQYDEETQVLIDEATQARENFQAAEKSVSELLTEIRKLEEKLDRDYGVDQEFAPLDGECFEYEDLEYVYTLCLFSKATQRSKSGGSDIILGHWYDWSGSESEKYSKMKYDRGLTCWNGPARSTMVSLVCGKENKLISVTEPSRCEYAMEFSTPTLCNPGMVATDTHDEL
ncbi:glucosidase 2 subunit beta [Ceratina calcarata]|uniref:Glucosidase 2 subunit beta n=1 Tax=Ceratina calcarata TaxID=156304 RepID=A0AAJ7S095_9HYME|nr:glucosidase 2 subunit beta [Ceratina calcarata]XP_026668980.1 glucosidase 2 subunit beta [Ceratina calcarata]